MEQQTVFASLEVYADSFIKDFVEKCTLCGICFDVCPILSHSVFHGDSIGGREKFVRFLENGTNVEEIKEFLDVCIECRHCMEVCPEGLDPFLLNTFIKPRLSRLGLVANGFPNEGPYIYLPDVKYNFMKTLAAIQTRPSEKRWLTALPADPPKVDTVFFPSCGEVAFPDKLFLKIDILEKMGVDFVTIGPYENGACCGVAHIMAGDYDKSEVTSRNLIDTLELFRPDNVVVGCPHTYRWVRDVVPHFRPYSFTYQHFFRYVSEHLDLLDLNPVNLKVTIHDPCPLARGVEEWDAPRKILQSIPGIELVEMRRIKGQAPCCGENVPQHLGDLARSMRHGRLQEAVDTGASCLTTICPACDHQFNKDVGHFPITIRNVLSVLAESVGIEPYQNKLEHYRAMGNIDHVLNETADIIAENGYTAEELRKPAARYLFGEPLDPVKGAD